MLSVSSSISFTYLLTFTSRHRFCHQLLVLHNTHSQHTFRVHSVTKSASLKVIYDILNVWRVCLYLRKMVP